MLYADNFMDSMKYKALPNPVVNDIRNASYTQDHSLTPGR